MPIASSSQCCDSAPHGKAYALKEGRMDATAGAQLWQTGFDLF
jgi:hypothetical protein